MSVFPARQCAHEETSAVGRIAASEVADCDMRGLVCGSTRFDESVKDHRDDDDTAAKADQPSEQPGRCARNHPQKDQPKGAHPALSEST
jgi:hypothetical protein